MSLFEDDAPDVADALRYTAQGISGGGNAVIQGLRTLASGLVGGAAGNLLFSPLVLGFGALAIGTGALISAFKSATNEATQYSCAMASLRASQGLSFNQSFALAGNNKILGISTQTTAQMFAAPGMNPIVAGLRARVFGAASPYDPNSIAKNAVWYQKMASQGVFGRQIANTRLDAIYGGQAPEEVRLAMNQRPGLIAGNLAYAANMRKQMGVTGETQRKYAEDIPMAQARVSYAFDMAKVRLAVEVAPLLERSLTTFATLLANNAPRIAQGIQTIGKFLVQDFPPMLMRGAAWVARGLGNMLMGFSAFTGALVKQVRPTLAVFDTIVNGLRQFGGVVAGIGGALIQGVGTLYNGIANSKLWQLFKGVASWTSGAAAAAAKTKLPFGIPSWLLPPAAGAAAAWVRGHLAPSTPAGGASSGPTTYGAQMPAAPNRWTQWVKMLLPQATAASAGASWLKRHLFPPANPTFTQMTPAQAAAAQQQRKQVAWQAAAQARASASNPLAYNPNRTVMDAFNQNQSAFLANVGTSNTANSAGVGTLEMMFGKASQASGAAGKSLVGFGDTLDNAANDYQKQIAEQLAQLNKTANKIDANTNKGADSQAELIREFPNMMRQLVALTSSFIAQDAAMSLLGSG